MNKTTENLEQALRNYTAPNTEQTVYRLTYNKDTGKPIAVTTEPTDQPYIEISRELANTQPQLDPRYKVIDGALIKQVKKIVASEEPNTLAVKLSESGNIATDDYNMLIIDKAGKNRWSYE
jgi:hypothetical protein